MKADNLPWTMIACGVPMLVGLFLDYTTLTMLAGIAFGWSGRFEFEGYLKRKKAI